MIEQGGLADAGLARLGNGVTDLEVAGATLREMVRMQLALGPHAARTPRTSHTRCLDRNAA